MPKRTPENCLPFLSPITRIATHRLVRGDSPILREDSHAH